MAVQPHGNKDDAKAEARQAAAGAAYVVFISHSSSDSWVANQMAKEIEALGAKAWLDRHDLNGGDELRKQIVEGIRACREFVLLLSPQSTESHWVSIEIGAALGQRKRVTPILHQLSHKDFGPLEGIKAVHLNDFETFLLESETRIRRRTR